MDKEIKAIDAWEEEEVLRLAAEYEAGNITEDEHKVQTTKVMADSDFKKEVIYAKREINQYIETRFRGLAEELGLPYNK